MSHLTAGVIIIGNEILSGRTKDSNANFIAKELIKIGIQLSEIRVIPDQSQEIKKTVIDFHKKFTYVFTTGGIGPTHDDITSESIAKAFKKKCIINPIIPIITNVMLMFLNSPPIRIRFSEVVPVSEIAIEIIINTTIIATCFTALESLKALCAYWLNIRPAPMGIITIFIIPSIIFTKLISIIWPARSFIINGVRIGAAIVAHAVNVTARARLLEAI